jgi:hypothetical protein
VPDPDDVIHDLETIKPGGNVGSCSNEDVANREVGAGESNGSWTTVELVVSAKGSTSSVWDWDWAPCPTTRRVGVSDVDSCIGSEMSNLERELAIKAGGGDGRGGGVSVLDGASWKRVLPDSPLVPLCPEIGLILCGRSMGLELGPASVPGTG